MNTPTPVNVEIVVATTRNRIEDSQRIATFGQAIQAVWAHSENGCFAARSRFRVAVDGGSERGVCLPIEQRTIEAMFTMGG